MGPINPGEGRRTDLLTAAVRLVLFAAVLSLLTTWAGCFGCPCGSGPGGMYLTADSLDLAILEDAETVRLEIELDHPSDDLVFEGEVELLPGGPAGWLVPAGIDAVPLGGCDFVGEATFVLLVDGEEWPDAFPPITVELNPVYGGMETVVLWEDWIVDIDWGGWVA